MRTASPAPATSDGAALVGLVVAALRDVGVDVTVQSEIAATEALALVGLGHDAQVVTALRATLVHRPEDLAAFEVALRAALGVGGRLVEPPPRPDPPPLRITLRHDGDDGEDAPDDVRPSDDDPHDLTLRFSRTEVLRHADLARLTDDERAEALRTLGRLRASPPPTRPSQRHVATRRRRGRLDTPGTLRRSLRHAGEVLDIARTQRGTRPRRVVLLLDVSGSMEPYARATLRFAHVLAMSRGRVEVFALGTRLTRVTRALRSRDADRALELASAAVADWSGGTRLGETIAAFNDRWGQRGLAHGAVVVVLSDGWDRGDPDDLAEQVARLQRVAHELVWVNPLVASPGFAPTARGMAAALPHVDRLHAGHSIASLEALADVLTT